jgi:inner membrane protein
VDNLTHTLAGAALGEAGLKRLSGLGMAALAIGANLPDLDVLAIPLGANLTFRRGWTHGPLALLVLPVLLTVALVGWDRLQARRGKRPGARPPVRPRQLLLLSFVGVLSHPFLDWLNSYGIRLLMPFSERWFYGDSIFIVDPWIWLALGIGVFAARRRARRGGGDPRRMPRVSLALVGAYVLLMVLGSRSAHDHAVRHMREAEGSTPLRVMAGPVPLDPTRRQLIYDMGGHYRFGTLRWRPGARVELEAAPLPTGADHPAARAALAEEPVRDFLYWSRFPFFEVEDAAGATRVRVADARFARRAAKGWASVEVTVPGAAPPRPE